MRRLAAATLLVAIGLWLGAPFGVLAHGGTGVAAVQVEPSAITAGQSVVLAGEGLEPDSDRVIVLAGGDLTIQFGTVRTDADGMFSKELTIPAYLPAGTYELRAIGDETLTASLDVTAAAVGAGEPPVSSSAGEAVVPRERTSLELGGILGLVLLSLVAGGWLIWRAERFGGTSPG